MENKKTILKSTYLKKIYAKDKEITLLKSLLVDQKEQNTRIAKMITNMKNQEYDFDTQSNRFSSIIGTFSSDVSELRRYMLETYRLMEECVKIFKEIKSDCKVNVDTKKFMEAYTQLYKVMPIEE